MSRTVKKNSTVNESLIELDMNDSNISNMIEEAPVNYVEGPIQLIEFKGNTFKLNQNALEIINSIQEEVIVIAIVGKARTGKSYMMNLLLDNIGKSNGFQVDSSINSCTKGIWLWGNFRKSLSGKAILFIDSEGTSAADGNRTYDSRIFALVVLISSLFIYNTTSNIDEHGISELSLAAHLSNAITTNSNIDKDSVLTELAPKFIWLLRDFTLEKIHPDTGQEITSKEYLEICLRKKISGKNSNDNNLIRNNIIKYFPDRDCITLVRPVESEVDLKRLNQIPFNNLKSNFKLEFKELKDKIFKETLPKKFQGKRLNGPSLAHLIVEFVNTINSGSIPNINNSWDSVIQKDIKDYSHKALLDYRKNTHKLNKTDYEQEDIIKYLYDYKLDSLMIYNKLIHLNSDTFSNIIYLNQFNDEKFKLEEDLLKIEEKTVAVNLEKTDILCKDVIRSEYKIISKKISDNYYTTKLIHTELIEDFNNFLINYADKCKGVHKLKILKDFLIQNEPELITYLIKIYNSENENKIRKVDKDIKESNILLEDFDSKNKYLEEENKTYESRIKNLEREGALNGRNIDDLKERIENLQKEKDLLKQSKQQGINYTNPVKNTKKPADLEDIVSNIDDKKERKKKESGCKCNIY